VFRQEKSMQLVGLMITRDDEAIFEEWCRAQLSLYDAVVCLDGSESGATAGIAARYAPRLVHLHERDFRIPYKTDHGLRHVVHQEIVRRFGYDNWVMCCHADEFCYHDPRKVARKAEREGYDLVSWFSLHFYPHPSERDDWPTRRLLPVQERLRHYHWDHAGSGLPWREDRLYRNGPHLVWDQVTHGSVRPHQVRSPAPFHPALLHYKVFTDDPDWYERAESSTFFRKHWPGLPDRTGLPFAVADTEDFFVSAVPGYLRCDRFDGVLRQPWNLGEDLRPDACCLTC
jgi:hypothetical protein